MIFGFGLACGSPLSSFSRFLPAASRFGAIGADDIRGLGPAWRGRCSPLTLSRLLCTGCFTLWRDGRRWCSVLSAAWAHLLARLSRFLGCFVPAASRFGTKSRYIQWGILCQISISRSNKIFSQEKLRWFLKINIYITGNSIIYTNLFRTSSGHKIFKFLPKIINSPPKLLIPF